MGMDHLRVVKSGKAGTSLQHKREGQVVRSDGRLHHLTKEKQCFLYRATPNFGANGRVPVGGRWETVDESSGGVHFKAKYRRHERERDRKSSPENEWQRRRRAVAAGRFLELISLNCPSWELMYGKNFYPPTNNNLIITWCMSTCSFIIRGLKWAWAWGLKAFSLQFFTRKNHSWHHGIQSLRTSKLVIIESKCGHGVISCWQMC